MVTYTLKHGVRDDLGDLWTALGAAFTYATNGNRQGREQLEELCVGFIVAKEARLGAHGWHPHLHVSYYVRPGVGLRQLDDLVANQAALFNGHLERHSPGNFSKRYSSQYGVKMSKPVTPSDIEEAGEKVSKYLVKDAARELTSHATKAARGYGSRSGFAILLDAAAGDELSRKQYAAYEEGMRRRNRLRWSPGMESVLPRELRGGSMEDDQNRGIAELPSELYDALRYRRWEGGIGLTDLMNAIEEEDSDELRFRQLAWLCAEHGLPDPHPVFDAVTLAVSGAERGLSGPVSAVVQVERTGAGLVRTDPVPPPDSARDGTSYPDP